MCATVSLMTRTHVRKGHTVETLPSVADILADGGVTFSLTGATPHGFMVSREGREETHDAATVTDADVSAYVLANLDALRDAGAFLGAWVHAGRLYLDVSDAVPTRDAAVTLGRARRQLAVYDLAAGAEIACA